MPKFIQNRISWIFQRLNLLANLTAENLALRHQLVVLKRNQKRPALKGRDRMFWVLLSRIWSGWRDAVVIVQPDTVVRWHKRRSNSIGSISPEVENAEDLDWIPKLRLWYLGWQIRIRSGAHQRFMANSLNSGLWHLSERYLDSYVDIDENRPPRIGEHSLRIIWRTQLL